MFATVWPGFHKFSQVIMLYDIYSIKHYHLFFKEFFIMSQNRHTSTTGTAIAKSLEFPMFQLQRHLQNSPWFHIKPQEVLKTMRISHGFTLNLYANLSNFLWFYIKPQKVLRKSMIRFTVALCLYSIAFQESGLSIL